MTERLANLDPMILAAVLVLLLAVVIVGIGLVNSLYGPRARLERRLKNVGEGSVVVTKGGKSGAQTTQRFPAGKRFLSDGFGEFVPSI